MSYAEDFYYEYLKPLNIRSFTHKDILRHTTATCCYSVLVSLKKLLSKENLILIEKKLDYTNGVKEYTIEEKDGYYNY